MGANVAESLKSWLLNQMNTKDALDGVAVTVKLAVSELGSRSVARELRRLADSLERTGDIPGWKFPAAQERSKTRLRSTTGTSTNHS
jgi:hypothetical protein